MPDDERVAEATSGGAPAGESLSCVSCRTRKLRCDRTKPICARCARVNGECVYPESRRKPAFKRRNVKELEARLAQVEVLLQKAGENRRATDNNQEKENLVEKDAEDDADEFTAPPFDFNSLQVPGSEDVFFQGIDYPPDPTATLDGFPTTSDFTFNQQNPTSFPPDTSDIPQPSEGAFNFELMDLGGVFEPLPPLEVIEDLHKTYFTRQQQFVPMIHPARYLQAWYSAPHMKPPMCLQYAMWALVTVHHPKYHIYHDVFYKRARQYCESDELKGHGEHFITLQHAQAWCCIATCEAKKMLFTRAAMSCARAVRLIHMMGLHRLDSSSTEASPTLLPPKDWVELEERRRTFWGIFCIDSHMSISTGWPLLLDPAEITTHLPSTESAFQSGQSMETCTLQDAFRGSKYSSFAGTIVICHVFNIILKHVHKPTPDDNPGDFENGAYWQRHREIDNLLTCAFMFLPDGFRLPGAYRDHTATHTNLNLHASTICLQHAAIERIDDYNLPDSAKKASLDRLATAAQEIITIVKMIGMYESSLKSPLTAFSLYCAGSVYVYFCKECQVPGSADNLNYVVTTMETIAQRHMITRASLRQLVLDIDQSGIQRDFHLPKIDDLITKFGNSDFHNIPLLARSRISRHTKIQPPLPGRLPLGKPTGDPLPGGQQCDANGWYGIGDSAPDDRQNSVSDEYGSANKRKRVSPSSSATPESFWAAKASLSDTISATPSSHSPQENNMATGAASRQYPTTDFTMNLPHRAGSPAVNAGSSETTNLHINKPQPPKISGPSQGILGDMLESPGLTRGEASQSYPPHSWGMNGESMYTPFLGPGESLSGSRDLQAAVQSGVWPMGGSQGVMLDWDAPSASSQRAAPSGTDTTGDQG
ncbi:hypothetical protein F4778DRAFT_800107 [Xylariomycetidae sp. FL2044]|nr:hypothetical protein F4778DRAFT_800107 [Xylariomycetidae sp. FL2044]